jgi:glycosyltransferase involved in cell wall biosynthesis
MNGTAPRVAVVIPCYRVRARILEVIRGIGPEASAIYVVDDACPERAAELVRGQCTDARVTILTHAENQGVGAAMTTGYRAALVDGADIVVKVDGDGQMDPALIPRLLAPIMSGEADYTKGNRFYDLAFLSAMPKTRLLGNAMLSLVSKVASGYWDIMDPTNGYVAIHRTALSALPLGKLDRGYFFESDVLFRLYTIRAVVRDVPIPARYRGETSSLSIGHVAVSFPLKYIRAACKRIFYAYFLRDFNAGTLQLALGLLLAGSGTIYGAAHWIHSAVGGVPATSGVVMIAALPVLIGFQLLLGALSFDVQNVPREPLQRGGSLFFNGEH